MAEDDVYALLVARLKEDGDRALFAGKHVAPPTHADVPDDTAVRLVVVSPRFPHRAGSDDSPALAWARDVLDHRANSPRLNRNMLVFAAFDEESHAPLVESTKSYLAWKSIVDEKRQLNLDENQVRQATEGRDKALQSVDALLGEGYRWAILPQRAVAEEQGKFKVGDESLRAMDTAGRLGSTGTLARRIASALQQDELLLEAWSPMFLKRELDRWFWPQGLEHISVKKLWEENLTRYVYFPRLRDRDVFMKAVQEGAASRDFFGYAVGVEGGKYVGLSFGRRPQTVLLDGAAVIVRKDIAEAAMPAVQPGPATANGPTTEPGPGADAGAGGATPPPTTKVMRRFYGSVKLNHLKVSSSAGQVADEVVKHLTGLVDAEVEVVLEVRARAPGGIPETVVRIVGENARTLKFQSFEFEED